MLVLTRRRRESVVVGGHDPFQCLLKVTVLDIGGGRVRLGFEAADEYPVHRWEVWQRICDVGEDKLANDGPVVPAA